MSLEELQAEFRDLSRQLDPIANRRSELDREIKRRIRDVAARQRLRALSDDEKAALSEALAGEHKQVRR